MAGCRNTKARGGSTPPPAYEDAVQADEHDHERQVQYYYSEYLHLSCEDVLYWYTIWSFC